jgi:hypothetical protein
VVIAWNIIAQKQPDAVSVESSRAMQSKAAVKRKRKSAAHDDDDSYREHGEESGMRRDDAGDDDSYEHDLDANGDEENDADDDSDVDVDDKVATNSRGQKDKDSGKPQSHKKNVSVRRGRLCIMLDHITLHILSHRIAHRSHRHMPRPHSRRSHARCVADMNRRLCAMT